MTIRVMLVDDHKIVIDGLTMVIESQPDMKIVAVAQDGRKAVQDAADHSPDVIIMDIGIPKLNGIEATRRIVEENPRITVLALSVHTDSKFVSEMLKAGAKAYLPKDADSDELILAIRTLIQGRQYISPLVAGDVIDDFVRTKKSDGPADSDLLTTKEIEVLQLIAEGKSSKEIASELNNSVRTVEAHRARIMKKLNLTGVAELTKYAVRHGLVSIE